MNRGIFERLIQKSTPTASTPTIARKLLNQYGVEGGWLDCGTGHLWLRHLYPGPAQDYRDGTKKAIGFLVGQVMRATAARQIRNWFLEKQKSVEASVSGANTVHSELPMPRPLLTRVLSTE